MSAMEAPAALAVSEDEAMAQLFSEIRTRRDEFGRQRFVPREFIAKLKKLGVYRAATPQCFGGSGLAPTAFLQLIEKISEADGSVGWVASFGSASVYLAALPKETQAKLYADSPDLVFAGGLFPIQPATQVEGGWNVNGTWKFASGCKGADMLGVGIGAAVPGQVGAKPRTAVFPPEKVEIIDNWDVMGLAGTGSHDLRVTDQFVADEWTFIRGGVPTIDEPLYRYPTIAYAAQVLGVVNLGIARAAIDEINHMSGGRVAITGAPKLADRSYVRIEVAKAEAQLRSARAFLYDVTNEVWQSILAGKPVTPEQVSMLRLTAVEVAKVGNEVVQSMFGLAGTTAIYSHHPLQRYLRDAAVVKQHAFLGEGIYDGAGAVALGVPPMPGFL
ncbi:acyl-CoA dehydrogenase family protein [Herbaspirillum sp. alder98]|uniref:acyl-CoA dehydrogenase family protein n=1 Tax=Herbaspirillum sp. alder98 TaxID=2913096 RepID=UPI001CD825BC|nr:acyl-CoA dehydrogenase family protein [Herbaspirillum sp. alder98]MCA1325820.1 acyl-CoA dehydrogenase family protein [Herbaspirillum sp. alder98]